MSQLSEVESWTPDHLVALAAYANSQGALWSDGYTGALAHVQGLSMRGETYDALAARQAHDTGVASDLAGTSMTAGEFASAAAGDLDALHSPAVFAINSARSAQFSIDPESLALTDNLPSSTVPAEREARDALRQSMSQDIKSTVQAFQLHRQTVAGVLQGHHNDLTTHPGVQMVDNRSFKTTGGNDDNPFNDPPMKPVGDEPIIGSNGGSTNLEQQVERDLGSNLPAMPGDWPRQVPAPSPPGPTPCKPEEYARKVADNVVATAGTTLGLAMIPISVFDPLFLPWAIAEARGVEAVYDTSNDVIDCAERGFGG